MTMLGVLFRVVVVACALTGTSHSALGQDHSHDLSFYAFLSGLDALPPNDSLGIGSAKVTLDLALFTMRVEAQFSGLTGTVTAAHVRGNTAMSGEGSAGIMTPMPSLPLFPMGVNEGTYDHTLDLTLESSYNPAFITFSGGTISLASNALIFGLSAGTTYLSIATTTYGGGEIRGFLYPPPKADFTHDGRVDGADLTVWTDEFGGGHHGDANGDGVLDGADFLIWQQELGAVAGMPGHHHGVPVPEPASLCQGVGMATLLVVGCRKWLTGKPFRRRWVARWPLGRRDS